MRRVLLLALLALALPTAALASSFDFPSGNFVSGTISGFTNALASGFVTRMGGEVGIHAPSSSVEEGTGAFDFHFSGSTLSRDEPGVQGQSTVPEPGTLGLLGTGVIGLAWLIRRNGKLRM